jgi:pilus assembly protein FimV
LYRTQHTPMECQSSQSMSINMHSNIRTKFMSFNLKKIGAAVISTLIFSASSHAAGLGKLTVLSSLGQPLQAEIELAGGPKEDAAGTLVAKLASTDAFRQANIDFNPALLALRFNIEQRGARQIIRISSSQPMNEPFVDMLLEFSGGNTRLIREYTFLLDPADLRVTQPVQFAPLAAPETRVSQVTRPITQPDVAYQANPSEKPQAAVQQVPRNRVKPATTLAKNRSSNEYQVKRGDSLAKIAGQLRTDGVSLDQMLVALYRANPDAFMGNNMNRLQAGHILSIPDVNAVNAITSQDAKNVIVAQAVDFSSYRNKLAGQVANTTPQKTAPAKQSDAGKINTKVEELSTPANESKDKLKLSKTGPTPGAVTDKAAPVSLVIDDDKIAKEKALAEASTRVKQLEKNVVDLQKILEIKNQSLEEQQKQAELGKDAKPVVQPATAVVIPDVTNKKVTATASATASAVVPKPVARVQPETSMMDGGNPWLIPGIGLLLVGLGGFGFFKFLRRKHPKLFADPIVQDASLKANSIFGSTGGQNVDTNNSVFNSNFTASTTSQLDNNEVDPVAEADVYIAYGRDTQAEEILKEALRTQPDRHAVRVKLLEIYANRKELRSFELVASELYGLTKGVGKEWLQAATLGMVLDPKNPLYAAARVAEGMEDKNTLMQETRPLDELDLEALLATTQSSQSLETLNTIEDSSAYFGNTVVAMATPPVSAPELPVTPVPKVAPAPVKLEVAPVKSNELDFDLNGTNVEELIIPTASSGSQSLEFKSDLGMVDFDFLKTPDTKVLDKVSDNKVSDKLTASHNNASEFILEDNNQDLMFHETNIPAPKEKAAPPLSVSSSNALDFDFSGISLDINPSDSIDDSQSDNNDQSGNSEMGTKLDLAVAYQEIGDKEGARELLDEVLKGGTVEQIAKARAMLHKLA